MCWDSVRFLIIFSLFNKIRVPLIRNEYVYFEMAINPVGGNGVSAYVNDYSTSSLHF